MSDIYPIQVPKWGIEMVEGTVAAWRKAEGEPIAKGDEVLEIESDKIMNVWESPTDGILRRRIAQEGDTLNVGALLGVIAADGVADADIDAFVAGFGSTAAAAKATSPVPQQAAAPRAAVAAATADGGDAGRRVNPVVRRLADELGVDLDRVSGTGRNGRITTEDVQRAAQAKTGGEPKETAADTGASEYDLIALSPTRKTIAKRLTEAKQSIPHFYLNRDFEIDGLMAHRAKLNADGGTRVSLNDLLVWCAARALLREPRVNVNVTGDEIHRYRHAHVAVAIATDDGLFPATIRRADTLSPAEIAKASAALAEKARAGKLEREDISGGTFTVSNLGMFGIDSFSAIINPPMGAILALGKGQPRCVPRGDKVEIATVVSATLACDHRVIDGAVGARFLQVLAEEIAALR